MNSDRPVPASVAQTARTPTHQQNRANRGILLGAYAVFYNATLIQQLGRPHNKQIGQSLVEIVLA